MGLRSIFASWIAAGLLAPCMVAQGPGAAPNQTALQLNPPLLPASLGTHTADAAAAAGGEPPFSLSNANQAALEECGPQRSAVQNYSGGLRAEAVEFNSASGALAAFSMLSQPGMREVKGVGQLAREGAGGVLLLSGASVAVVFPASAVDPAVKALAAALPKVAGVQALQPLLPELLPTRGLAAGSARYALGSANYMAEGGVLPAAGLGWTQDAEAETAKYSDRRGTETLTLLLYPTPTIAGAHLRQVQALLPGLGPSFRTAKARREGSLVVLANGTFSADAAQALAENTHLKQVLTTDKAMPTPEVVETRKTFGLLANIILFSGLLGAAAIGVGLFLGGGRAIVRILRGKPAASEAEFLSLHLDPQNAAPRFGTGEASDPR